LSSNTIKKVMKNVIETLDRYYQSFINQNGNWEFFLGLADYVKYAVKTQEVDSILKRIVQVRDNDQKRLKEYEQRVIKETEQAKEKLFKIIKEHKISNEALDRAIEEYQGYENGTTLSSQSRGEALSEALIDIIHILFKNGHKELVKNFAIEHREAPNEVGKYTFSKTLELYEKEKEIFNEKLKTELWASWDNLVLAYLTIFKADEELEKLHKDKKDLFMAWNFSGLVGEMRKIRDGNRNRLTGIASDFKPIHFKKENYISHATRIHNYLIQKLSKEKDEQTEKRVNFAPPSFDKDKGILYIQNKEIKITKFTDQYDMLDLIFKSSENQQKDWQYSEIQEFIDQAKPSDWKRLYNIAYALRNKIAIETGIKDFFLTTTQSIKINPKYLQNSSS